MPFTYILRCADGSLYTGWTTNLEERVQAHNEGKGGRYTRCRNRLPVTLVYWESYPTRQEAQRREEMIKNLSRQEKEALIAFHKKETT